MEGEDLIWITLVVLMCEIEQLGSKPPDLKIST